MTEVPEHLLQRSRERRQALGLPVADGGGDAAPAASAPAPAASAERPVPAAAAGAPATPAPAAAPEPPPPPAPLPPYVAAAHARKRIPVWAMPVLAGLPLWAFIFATTLTPPGLGENDPLTVGREVYMTNCASCHGATGGGGVGPGFTNGDIVLTFPDPFDHIAWIEGGAESAGEGGAYGDPTRPGGQRTVDQFSGVMPGFATSLTPEEIAAVVRYEREVLGGAEPEEDLVALTEGEGAAEGGGGGEGGEATTDQQGGSDSGTPTTSGEGTGSSSDDPGEGEDTDEQPAGSEGGTDSTEDTTGSGGG